MPKKPASVKDIAARLHISLSTVHKALTGKPGVSEARRSEVLAVAEELGYVVNTAAQSLARKNINLGIIMPTKWQEFFAEMKEGMEQEISAMSQYKVRGFFFYVSDTSDMDDVVSKAHELELDAILACSSTHTFSAAMSSAIEKLNLPAFWVGGGLENPRSVCDITIDASLSGKMAADFFSSTLQENICAAVFTGSLKIGVHRMKTEAFCQRITEYGGSISSVCETDDNEAVAYEAVCNLFREHPETNSIYINTSTSEAVCRYIHENSLCNKVIILGTDVFDTLRKYIKLGIMKATIYQNQEKVGHAAIRCAYDYLNQMNSYKSRNEEQKNQILIPPLLLLRANIE